MRDEAGLARLFALILCKCERKSLCRIGQLVTHVTIKTESFVKGMAVLCEGTRVVTAFFPLLLHTCPEAAPQR